MSVRGRDSVTKSAVGVFISTFWTVASKNLWMFYCDSGVEEFHPLVL